MRRDVATAEREQRKLDPPKPKPRPPAEIGSGPNPSAEIITGDYKRKVLCGCVALVTGASRGLGKGVAEELAAAGAIVFLTGRGTATGESTDALIGGSVDQTAAELAKLGGYGVAVHVDHSQHAENAATARLLEESGFGRLDVLVNNAFFIPKPDRLFFSAPVWRQPVRFLNEQIAVGGLSHMAETLTMLPLLRRGRGCVLNISSWGSQVNIGMFPTHYYTNKAAFDQTTKALAEHLRKYKISSFTLWPGAVKSERMALAAKRTHERLTDYETARFTGRAVVAIANMPLHTMNRLAGRTYACADVFRRGHATDVDGYVHEPDSHTYVRQ